MFTRSIWEEMNDVRRSFDQLFENLTTYNRPRQNGESVFAPSLETGWTDESLNLRFVIPGVSQSDLNISVQGNQLLVRGERRAPENFTKDGVGYWQLNYGRFERAVDLPNGVDAEKLQANLHDGLLDIRIPIAEKMKPRQIPIQVGPEAKQLKSAA